MAAIYGHQILDRVRSICVAAPYDMVEAVDPFSFDLQPQTNADRVFRLEPLESVSAEGRTGMIEDRTDSLVLWVARLLHADQHVTRRALMLDVHSLTASIMRDGYTSSGDYAPLDEGKSSRVDVVPGGQFMALRLEVPVLYEVAQ